MPRTLPRDCRCLPFALLVAACAQGGTVDTPQSEVRIAANHHVFSFRTLPGFGTFPASDTDVFTTSGLFELRDDSTFQFTANGVTTSDRYAITKDGTLSVFFTGSGRDPSVVFRGGYGLVDDLPAIFFTDRVSTTSSPSIGLYYGTRVIPGQVDLEGDWHLLSLHVIFAALQPPPVAQTSYNIGRGVHGSIQVAAGQPGEARAITGTGSESGVDPNSHNLTFGGTIQNLLQNGTGDGSCNLTLDYSPQSGTDSRAFDAVAGPDYVLALDSDESDGEAGVAFLVRKFDAPATPADPARVAGDYLVGGHTLFVNPANAGADTFIGRMTLSTPTSGTGGFRLDFEDHLGRSFFYAGTYTVADDGGIAMHVNGTNETWFAAINRAYDTLFFVDDVVEVRANNTPELNLAMATRVKPVPP